MARLCPLFQVFWVLVGAGCSANQPGLSLDGAFGGSATATTGGSSTVDGVGGAVGNGGLTAIATGGTSLASGGTPTGGGATGVANGVGGRATSTGGSGSGGRTAAGGATYVVVIPSSALTATDPTCGVQAYTRERKPPEVILVLDRSASMLDPPEGGTASKWSMVVPSLTSVLQSTNTSMAWGMKLYPELTDTDACAPETIVPTIHVPVATNNGAAVTARINATIADGDGTPTGDAIKYATAHLQQRNAVNTNPKYILLATDGDPSCPSSDAIGYAVSAIGAALTAGFPTYVIGVDTAKTTSITRLNQMAVAGGRPRVGAATQFYLASTQADLTSALQSITGVLASCIFTLEPPPPVPDNIAVDFSGQRTPRDPNRLNGWEYTSADFTSLQVYGTWCERIKTEASNKVEIKYGCPNQPIPLPK